MITLSLVCSRAVYAGAGASAIADTDTQAKPIRNTINVAFVDAPPFSYLDSETRESGTLIELFREVAQQLALEPVFIYVPHKRQLEFIKDGQVDMWAGQKNSRIGDDISITSSTPLFSMELRAFWNKGQTGLASIDALHGKPLILISSYSYGGWYQTLRDNSPQVQYAINHENGFEKLFASKRAYLLGYTSIANEVFQKYQVNNFESAPLSVYPLHLKLANHFPNTESYMIRINHYLANRPLD